MQEPSSKIPASHLRFRAIWWVTAQKNGASALSLQQILGLGSYQTAWTWLHKLRTAIARPGRDKLSGCVEVDETSIGGAKAGKRGRGAENKVLVAVAGTMKGKRVGRIRLAIIDDASSTSLHGFVQECVEKGSTVRTDGWNGYTGLESLGYVQEVFNSKGQELFTNHRYECERRNLGDFLAEYLYRYPLRKHPASHILQTHSRQPDQLQCKQG